MLGYSKCIAEGLGGGVVDYWRWSLLVEGGKVSKSFDNVTLSFSMKTVVFLLIPEAYISFVTSL